MSTERLPCIELETAARPDATIIVLHGLGADGNDFVPVVDAFELPDDLAVRFVFPHAPVRRVTVNGGYPMRAWYDIADADLDRRADLAGVKESQAQIDALLRHEEERGIVPGRIVLAGFSQGGAVALYAGLRYPSRLAGIVGLSTYLIAGERLEAERSPANRDVPIFMAHGTQDPVVRFAVGRGIAGAAGAGGLPGAVANVRDGTYGRAGRDFGTVQLCGQRASKSEGALNAPLGQVVTFRALSTSFLAGAPVAWALLAPGTGLAFAERPPSGG